MRILTLVTCILGIAAIVFGVLFIFQAASGEKEIKDSIAPLTMDKVNSTYDQVAAQLTAIPKTDANYLPTSLQKTSLGLAKANIGIVKSVRMNGYVDIAVGIGLAFAGFVLYRKSAA